MFSKLLIFLLVALVSFTPFSVLPQPTCYNGVYIIGVRWSREVPGYGSVESIVSGVLNAIPNSGAIELDYPATMLKPSYYDFVGVGTKAMKRLIQSYVDI
jgi:hypothetical protein